MNLRASLTRTINVLLLFLLLPGIINSLPLIDQQDGKENYSHGLKLISDGQYTEAAMHLWLSVIHHNPGNDSIYTVKDAFRNFMKCYMLKGTPAEGHVFVAREYARRSENKEAEMFARTALSIDPDNEDAKSIMYKLGVMTPPKSKKGKSEIEKHTPESAYEKGNAYFEKDDKANAAKLFEKSCELSGRTLGLACANAIYCRTTVADWGKNGTGYLKDMERIEEIITQEAILYRSVDDEGKVEWKRSVSVNPHMALGYAFKNSELKRTVTESHALTDAMYGSAEAVGAVKWRDELRGFPYDQEKGREKFWEETLQDNFKLKVAFVSGGINSKAVMFLAHDFFRFYNHSKIEMHVFSMAEPDHPLFIKKTMRGVDWRERVKSNVDHFHQVKHIRDKGPAVLAKHIHSLGIHVLIDWDGYCRNGQRAQGLYHLRPAPIQILHQEYLGTYGGGFDYIVTDKTVSPPGSEYLFSEKFFYMPDHFFMKGHAMQKEVKIPTYGYKPATTPYTLGKGSPQENRCGFANTYGPASFVFCNFNKFLKFSPHMMRTWLSILESVPDSVLCLLSNPASGIDNLYRFVEENNPDLMDRFHFASWIANPFDHQERNGDFCNAILDCEPYNGHTTTMDALYAGVPVVTKSDGVDMSSLVTTSANKVLGLHGLNGASLEKYKEIAIKLGSNRPFYKKMRNRLMATILREEGDLHPFWDMQRYVKNFETGLDIVWERYLNGEDLARVVILDKEQGKKGGALEGSDMKEEL